MLSTFQSLALIHNKLKFYMYTRTLLTHTYYCFQYNDHNTIHNITLSLSYTHKHTHTSHTHARTHTRTHTHTHTHTHKAQNQLLRQNVIDARGNLLLCRKCLVSCLGVHTTRLTRQRIIKQKQKDQPILELTKREVVVEQRLEDYLLHDDEDDDILMFGAWWKLVDNDDIVEVQFPHKRHGLAGKESNHAKKQAMADFLEFVDINSQPNGLVAIVPNFFSFRSSLELRHLKWEKKIYEEQLQSFVVSQFNKAQRKGDKRVITLLQLTGSRSTDPR